MRCYTTFTGTTGRRPRSLVASLTTATGFAALMLASYGGMTSLGLTMTIGIAGALLGALLVIP